MLIPAEYQEETWKRNVLPAVDYKQTCSTGKSAAAIKDKDKVRRPPNAFIIFANEWRRNIAAENPGEKSKEISTRLGAMWRSLRHNEREQYMAMARQLNAEHKKKYPHYVYCPKVARVQKALRDEARNLKRRIEQSDKMNTAPPGTSISQKDSQQVHGNVFCDTVRSQDARAACTLPKPGSSWMFVDQERGHQETKGFERQVGQNTIQECTCTYLNVDKNAQQQSGRHAAY